jgi:hypothetical protein
MENCEEGKVAANLKNALCSLHINSKNGDVKMTMVKGGHF